MYVLTIKTENAGAHNLQSHDILVSDSPSMRVTNGLLISVGQMWISAAQGVAGD